GERGDAMCLRPETHQRQPARRDVVEADAVIAAGGEDVSASRDVRRRARRLLRSEEREVAVGGNGEALEGAPGEHDQRVAGERAVDAFGLRLSGVQAVERGGVI